MFKKIRKILLVAFVTYFIFSFSSGILVFFVIRPDASEYIDNIDINRFTGEKDEEGPDRAVLIDDRVFAGISRIYLIEKSTKSLDVSFHSVHKGLSSDMFYAALFQAADRGVEIRLLLDGIFHNFFWDDKNIYRALVIHPNIEIGIFEPVNLLKPWTLQNRLHDKFIISDNKFLMTGGSNVGDRYTLEDYQGETVTDRELVLYTETPQVSVIKDYSEYFDSLWQSGYTFIESKTYSKKRTENAKNKERELIEILEETRQEKPDWFPDKIEWEDISLPTTKATLIHNPVIRLNKEPWVLAELGALALAAKESIFMQSPYIVPARQMRKYLDFADVGTDLELLTNSPAVSPNLFAMSGYYKHKSYIQDFSTGLYEYHGPGSIHAKSYVFDGRISVFGSFNLDSRSAFLSTESMVVIDSEPLAEKLEESIMDYIAMSILQNGQEEEYKVEKRPYPIYKRFAILLLRMVFYHYDIFL